VEGATIGPEGTPPRSIAWDEAQRPSVRGVESEMSTTRSAEELVAPLGSVDTARLVFTRGAAHLTLRVDGSMEDLYRARFDGKIPDVRVDGGTVEVTYRMGRRPPRGEIVLSGRVPWAIQGAFGMSDVAADLEDLPLKSLEISGGANAVQVRLPRPTETILIRIGGGASNLELIRPTGVPIRVHVGGGVSKLAIDDFRVASAGGTTDWQSPDFEPGEGRYDVEIGAGASRVTIRT
jgi:hypothetical protein